MLDVQIRHYTLRDGRPLKIAFFRDEAGFRHSLTDHFLSPNEPWERVLGVHFLRSLRQKIDSDDVSVIGEAYARSLPVLDDGIRFSIDLPVYVEFEQERLRFGATAAYKTHGFYFLSNHGFLIVVREGIVRTAMYPLGGKGAKGKGANVSKWTLFREAWKYVKDRNRPNYVDPKDGENVRHLKFVKVSPDNWERCPQV